MKTKLAMTLLVGLFLGQAVTPAFKPEWSVILPPNPLWLTRAVNVCDGGTMFFGAEYDPATRTVGDIDFNVRGPTLQPTPPPPPSDSPRLAALGR
jgi:hypothetical protein